MSDEASREILTIRVIFDDGTVCPQCLEPGGRDAVRRGGSIGTAIALWALFIVFGLLLPWLFFVPFCYMVWCREIVGWRCRHCDHVSPAPGSRFF
jgi:hypothetical protein